MSLGCLSGEDSFRLSTNTKNNLIHAQWEGYPRVFAVKVGLKVQNEDFVHLTLVKIKNDSMNFHMTADTVESILVPEIDSASP